MMIEKYKRHNWKLLQQEFLEGNYNTLKEFAQYKNLNYNSSQFFVNTKNWLEIKRRVSFNPQLKQFDENGHTNNLLTEFPKRFYTSCKDIWINAAFTFIDDTRPAPCSLEQIAKWYNLEYELVRRRATKERWSRYRLQQKRTGFGLYEYFKLVEC